MTGAARVEGVRAAITQHLARIEPLFRPGAKLTLLVRNELGPDLDAEVVVTSDTLTLAIAALERRRAADEGRRAPGRVTLAMVDAALDYWRGHHDIQPVEDFVTGLLLAAIAGDA